MAETVNPRYYFEDNKMIMLFDEIQESGKSKQVKVIFDSENNKITRFDDEKLSLEWNGDNNVISIPAKDIVEVVRCKDCVYFVSNNLKYCNKHIDCWGSSEIYVDDDDFCSFGERRPE